MSPRPAYGGILADVSVMLLRPLVQQLTFNLGDGPRKDTESPGFNMLVLGLSSKQHG